VIYHAALPADYWEAALATGSYEISTRGMTLTDVGFIHASYEHQVEGVANTFYPDVDELVLLTIDRETIGAPVVDEPVPTGEEFPHIYGPLPVDAVVDVRPWKRQPGEPWRLSESRPDR
jgi:glutathione S-transferase